MPIKALLTRTGFAATLVLLGGLSARAQALPPDETQPFLPGEVIVQFKIDVTDAEIGDAFRQGGLQLIKHIRTPAMEDHGKIGLTRTWTAMPLVAALRILNRMPGVEFAEPNWVLTRGAASDDPLYLNGSLWGMYSDDLASNVGPSGTTNPYGSQAEQAWANGWTGSKDVFVGIVDEGLQFDHPDLAANIWTNPGEIPGNGLDDDGDGYVDDVHGWNAIDNNGNIYDPAYDDHGTHVAGTIGASGNNGTGVAGVNWDVTLISGKFLGASGGATSDAVEAIDYMTALKTRKGLNIVALNNSWGGRGASQALVDAISRAAQANILFCVAAMNWTNNNDLSPVYPASYDTTAAAGYDSIVAVAALDSSGQLAKFSDYGAASVDLGAPGVTVYSTLPNGTYGAYSGTSMATPHVTGAVALYASTHPGASALQARNDLLNAGVRATASLAGITTTGGRLDIPGFLNTPQTPLPAPDAPSGLQVALAEAAVNLTWLDQSGNELGFSIERSVDGISFAPVDTVGANLASYSDRTVRPANTYYYQVRAYNPGGRSAPTSPVGPVSTPAMTLPLAPASLTASSLPKGGVNLGWSDRSNNESSFQIERKTGTGAYQLLATVGANVVKYSDSSTATRVTYTYRVHACNAAGFSAYSNEVTVKSK